MTEMTWTTMHIGGSLPSDKIDDLIEAADCFCNRDGDFDEKGIRLAANENRSLCMQGDVNYGNPETLIDFCQNNNLPFWLHFGSGYEWDAGVQIWKPGDDGITEHGATDQGREPDISLQELRRAEKAGKTLSDVIADMARFENDWVPAIAIVEMVEANEPIGAITPSGDRLDRWDERLRASGCTPVYKMEPKS